MYISRDIVLDKLKAYLANKISKEEVYEWSLLVAVSRDFEEATQNDALLKMTVNAMIEINQPHKAPTLQTLEHYRRCLAGEEKFAFSESSPEPDKSSISPAPNESKPEPVRQSVNVGLMIKQFREWKYFRDAILTARLYVLIFAVCSLVVQASSLINPGFMQIGLWVPSRWQALGDALPHLIYAYLILLSPSILARGRIFLISLPLLALGAAFYWKLSFLIIIKLSLDWVFILAILPFSAIPATLALLLVLAEKFGLTKVPGSNSTVLRS